MISTIFLPIDKNLRYGDGVYCIRSYRDSSLDLCPYAMYHRRENTHQFSKRILSAYKLALLEVQGVAPMVYTNAPQGHRYK